MNSIYQLKPKFQSILRPIVTFLAKRDVSANQVTMLSLLISLVGGAVVWLFHSNNQIFFLLPFLLFIRMALNAIDGMLAREFFMESLKGSMLNEWVDVISDAALFLPFAFIPNIQSWMIILLVVLAFSSELLGVLAVTIGSSRRYDGPMGKSDRAFIFGIISLVMAFDGSFQLINGLLGLTCFLLLLTNWNRFYKAMDEVEQ